MTGKSLLSFHDWLVELRRHFHQNPELAYHEEKTAAHIAKILESLGVEFRSGIGGTGIVGVMKGAKPGPTIAMRADMDALPLEEKTEVPYRSKVPGIMHACGHDGHVTIALGTARLLIENDWPAIGAGKILFIFQPAEEGGAGAKAMLESGIFDKESVEAVFAGHMHPELTAGQIGIARDVSNAASDSIGITITGKGAHGAQPHLGTDPIVAGALLVNQLQAIISRNISPIESAVITIGVFHAGTARNIIPEQAVLEGTVRSLDRRVRNTLLRRLRGIAEGLEKGQGVVCNLRVHDGYPLVVNDSGLVDYVLETGRQMFAPENVHIELPRMGAEDFAFFAEKWPGILIRLGCRKPGTEFKHSLHSPWFDLDESALDAGVRLFASLLANYASTKIKR